MACKIVKTSDDETIFNVKFSCFNFLDKIKYEFENLKRLNNENIVRVHELYIDVVKGKIYTVMELVNGGEMFENIKNSGSYTEETAKLLFTQIL